MSESLATQTQIKTKPTIIPVDSGRVLQRQCTCGQHTSAGGECDECQQKREGTLQRAAINPSPVHKVPPIVGDVLRSPGQPLDVQTRAFMEPRFGHDFSGVKVHTDEKAAESARAVNALAYTVGNNLVFGTGQYAPGTKAGQYLMAHELTHVIQQNTISTKPTTRINMASTENPLETEADRVADRATRGSIVPSIMNAANPGIQRRVEMRDVGRGEQSGYARLPELIDRLNAISTGLTYSVVGHELAYSVRPGGTLSGFDRQMMAFIDQDAVIPLRLTNRHGLLHNPATGGFTDRVEEDAWSSGYVDIDDLLASDDLGFQSVLVHFIRERTATRNYARRIGSPSLDLNMPGPQQLEFNRAHDQGIDAEVQLLRDYFGDPSIHFIPGAGGGEIFRVYRNGRGDRIRTRVHARTGAQAGVDVVTIEVVLRDGRRLTAEEYRRLLEEERIARQVERERLGGAAEHQEGGRLIPAP
jgi:hypothetical protein